MPMMKDSGTTWIGEIPQDWSISRLKFNLSEPMKYGASESGVEYDENLYRYIRITDIDANGKLKEEGKLSLTEAQGKGYELKDKTVLFARSGGTVGKSFLYREYYGKSAFAGYLISAISNTSVMLPEWLMYFTGSTAYKEWANGIFTQATIQNIGADKYSNMPITIAPIEVQKRIVAFLDTKCAEIDALSADIQAQIDTLEEYKRSVITEAVTKGLNKDAEMQDSGIEWASQIPKHWAVMPNKYVMKKIKHLCPRYAGEDILSLTMNGVIVRDLDAGGKMPTSFDGYQWVYPGNLLMCLFDYDVTPRCIGLVKNKGLTSPAYSQFIMKNGNSAEYYYYYYLMIDYTKELLHLAKNLRHSFTEEQLGAINTPVPPVNEQIEIAHYLDEMINEVDAIISSKQEQLTVLDEYKKSTIYEYVTGKKEVPNE